MRIPFPYVLDSPWALFLFIPFLFMFYRLVRRGKVVAFAFPGIRYITIRKKSIKQYFAWLPPILFMIGVASLIIALARPQKPLARTQISSDAIAIEMSIDISGSMLALDFSERGEHRTRLDVVKETFKKFVNNRPSDLIGVVTFGGYATTAAPLTLDHKALNFIIDDIHVPGTRRNEIVEDKEVQTAVGDGLAMACARLSDYTNMASRVVVLLSDGETNEGIVSPEKAAEIAKQMGIKVYTIGVGSTGHARSLVFDERYQPHIIASYVSIDEEALKNIAEITGGNYYNVRDKHALENALATINELEKTEIDKQIYVRKKECFAHFLITGFVLCFLACLFSMRIHRGIV